MTGLLQPPADPAALQGAPSIMATSGTRRSTLSRVAAAAQSSTHIVGVIALVAELAVILADITGRALFAHSLLWSDEVAKLALSVIAFMGGAAAYRDGRHTAIHVMLNLLPARPRAILLAGTEWAVLLVALGSAWASIDLLQAHWNDVTPLLQMSEDCYVAPFTVGMVLIALFALERLLTKHSPRVTWPVGMVLIAVTAGLVWYSPFDAFANDTGLSLASMLALFFITVLLGLPVAFAMLLATLIYLLLTGAAPSVAIPQTMLDGVSNFILLALPFFIFAGLVMEKGGISLRLVRFAMSLVGWLRGGLLQVVVVTVFLVSGISGSKVADVAAVGAVMREELRRQNYRLEDGAAVLAASAAMAETIPPSIAMLVLGSVTPISIGTLFIAGLLPAAVTALCLMVLIYILARRGAPQGGLPVGMRPRWSQSVVGAILPLAMPVAMVVGIRFGVATPTEVSSFAVVYGIVLATVIYREMAFADLPRHAANCAATAGMVLFVLAAASAFAWVLTAGNLPQELVSTLHAAGDSRAVFMICSILLLIIVGSLLEGLPAITVLAPLLMPIAGQLGIDGVQYGIVLILAMGIGAFMPPIGIGFFVAAAVAESRFEGAARAMLPYLLVLVLAVLLIAFVPQITLVLPHALGD